MNALYWIHALRPALPMSVERPCTPMSRSELRRHMQQGGVVVNGEPLRPEERLNFPVFSIVFFPKSPSRRTTIL